MHLTFDDGPHPLATPAVLRILHDRNLRATFFLVGNEAAAHAGLVREIVAEGHQIGNHSLSHTRLIFRPKDVVQSEIHRSSEILKSIAGRTIPFFRPPFGLFNRTVLKSVRMLGMRCILWNIDSRDFKTQSSSALVARVMKKSTAGSILLFHDNDLTAQTVSSHLPFVLDTLLEKKFSFAPLPL